MRRLRRTGKVPGIIYGIGEPEQIIVDEHSLQLDLQRHEAFYSSVLNVEIDGRKQAALLREVQSHPVTGHLLHVDFQAVAENIEIAATVPLHFLDAENSPGVKLNHGIFSATNTELHVHCLPKDLPSFISIDVSHLDINDSIHLSDIEVPAGVRPDAIARGEDLVLAAVLPPQQEEEPIVDEAAVLAEGEVDPADEAATAEEPPSAS